LQDQKEITRSPATPQQFPSGSVVVTTPTPKLISPKNSRLSKFRPAGSFAVTEKKFRGTGADTEQDRKKGVAEEPLNEKLPNGNYA
jgi:hypothetical protein